MTINALTMSSNNHQHYDPTTFPLVGIKKKNTLEAGKLFVATARGQIQLVCKQLQNSAEFSRIFEDVERQCESMSAEGDELERLSKTWNLRKRLEARRAIKIFCQTGFELYIVTMRKSELVRLHLPSVSLEDIISVTSMIPNLPAGSDMTDAMNELISTPDLQESPDGDSSDARSIALSESSYITAITSFETDQPNPYSMIPPTPFSNHTSYTQSGVSPVENRPSALTPLLPSAIGSISPVNSPPMNPPPTSPPQMIPSPMSPPPTSPLPTGSLFTPTATSSPRGNLLPSGWNFQNSTIYFILPQNDQRSYSGNGSNFSDINTGVMKTFPQDFILTSPSN